MFCPGRASPMDCSSLRTGIRRHPVRSCRVWRRGICVWSLTVWDVLPRTGEPDGLLIAADRNPNTSGAKLLGVATGNLAKIAEGVRDGSVTALVCLGEDATKAGLTEEDLAKLDAVIALDILPN